jgi:hypothetical protein
MRIGGIWMSQASPERSRPAMPRQVAERRVHSLKTGVAVASIGGFLLLLVAVHQNAVGVTAHAGSSTVSPSTESFFSTTGASSGFSSSSGSSSSSASAPLTSTGVS